MVSRDFGRLLQLLSFFCAFVLSFGFGKHELNGGKIKKQTFSSAKTTRKLFFQTTSRRKSVLIPVL